MRFSKILVLSLPLLVIMFVFLVPVYQTPDEPAHLRYVEYLMENGFVIDPDVFQSGEILDTSLDLEALAVESDFELIRNNPNTHFRFSEQYSDSNGDIAFRYIFNHPPFYYALLASFGNLLNLNSFENLIIIFRLFNLFLFAISGYYVWRFASSVGKGYKAYLLYLSVMLWPMLLFLTAGVNNDTLLFTASIATFVTSYELLHKKIIRNRELVEMGFWIMIGFFSKAQFFPLLTFPVLVITLNIFWRKIQFKQLLLLFLTQIPVFLYYIHRKLVYNSFYPTPSVSEGFVGEQVGVGYELSEQCRNLGVFEYIEALIYPRYALLLQSFVGNFGWLDLKVPVWMPLLFLSLFLMGLISMAFYWVRRVRSETFTKLKLNKGLLLFLLIIVTMISYEIFYSALFFRSFYTQCYEYFPTQGRYYFPLLLPIMFILVTGLDKAVPKRFRTFYYYIMFAMLGMFLAYSISNVIIRYYL